MLENFMFLATMILVALTALIFGSLGFVLGRLWPADEPEDGLAPAPEVLDAYLTRDLTEAEIEQASSNAERIRLKLRGDPMLERDLTFAECQQLAKNCRAWNEVNRSEKNQEKIKDAFMDAILGQHAQQLKDFVKKQSVPTERNHKAESVCAESSGS